MTRPTDQELADLWVEEMAKHVDADGDNTCLASVGAVVVASKLEGVGWMDVICAAVEAGYG